MTMQNDGPQRKRGRPNRSQSNNEPPSRLLLQLLPRTSSLVTPCLSTEENSEKKKKITMNNSSKKKGNQKVFSLKPKNRESHNADEKRRKEKLNKLIVKLKDLLALDGKKSKVAILEQAVEFISKHQKQTKSCDLDYVNQKIKSLETIIVSLIDLLSCNSVSLPNNIQIIKTSSNHNSDISSETLPSTKDIVHIIMDCSAPISSLPERSITKNSYIIDKTNLLPGNSFSKENLTNIDGNSLVSSSNLPHQHDIMVPYIVSPSSTATKNSTGLSLSGPASNSIVSFSNNLPETSLNQSAYHVTLSNGIGLLNMNPIMSITQITSDQKQSEKLFENSEHVNEVNCEVIKLVNEEKCLKSNKVNKFNETENLTPNLSIDLPFEKNLQVTSSVYKPDKVLLPSELLTSKNKGLSSNQKQTVDVSCNDVLKSIENPAPLLIKGKKNLAQVNNNVSNENSFKSNFPVKAFGIDNLLVSNTNITKKSLLKTHKRYNHKLSCSGHTVAALLENPSKAHKVDKNLSILVSKESNPTNTPSNSSFTENINSQNEENFTEDISNILPSTTVSQSLFGSNSTEYFDNQSNTSKRWTNVVSNAQNSNILIASFPLFKKTTKCKAKKPSQKGAKNDIKAVVNSKNCQVNFNVPSIRESKKCSVTSTPSFVLEDSTKNKINSINVAVNPLSCISTSVNDTPTVISTTLVTDLPAKNSDCRNGFQENTSSTAEVFTQPSMRTMKDRTIRNKWLERDKTCIDVGTFSIEPSFEQQASPVISFPNAGYRKRNIDIVSTAIQPTQKRTFLKPSFESRNKVANRARSFSVESLSKSAIQTYNDKQLSLPSMPIVSSYSSSCCATVQKLKHQPELPLVTPLPTILNIFAPAQVPVSSMQQSTFQGNMSNFSAENLISDGCGLMNENIEENSFNQNIFMTGNQQMFSNYSSNNLINPDQSSFPYAIDNLIAQNTTPIPIWNASWVSQDYNCDLFQPMFNHMQNSFNRRITTECSPIKSIISILQSTSNQPNQNIQFNQIPTSDFSHTQQSIMQNYALPDGLSDEQNSFSNNFSNRHSEVQNENSNSLQLESMQNSCELPNNRVNNNENHNNQLSSDLYNTPPIFPFSQWQDFQTKNKV